MLRVKTNLQPSLIPGAGLGLFAAEPIAAGAVVWRFDDGYDLRVDRLSLPADMIHGFADALDRHGYLVPGGDGRYVFCVDDARFVNHSKTPNLVDEEGKSVAARDIGVCEELTSDYDLMCAADPVLGWTPGDGHTPAGRRSDGGSTRGRK